MSLGITEIILILVVVLVLFGGKKIPELARGLGKAQAEYKKAKEMLKNEAQDLKDSVEQAAQAEEKKAQENKENIKRAKAAQSDRRSDSTGSSGRSSDGHHYGSKGGEHRSGKSLLQHRALVYPL